MLLLDLSHCHRLHLDAVESISPSSNLSSCCLVSLAAVKSIAPLNLSWHHGTYLAICLHRCGLSYASVALLYTLHSHGGPWHCRCQVAEGWQVLGCSCHCSLCWYLLPLSWGHVAMLSLARPAYHCYGSYIGVTSVAEMGVGSHGVIQSLGILIGYTVVGYRGSQWGEIRQRNGKTNHNKSRGSCLGHTEWASHSLPIRKH